MQIGSKTVPDTGRFQKARRLKDMKPGEILQFRIVNGPLRVWSQMWPTMAENKTTGIMTTTWRSAISNKDDTNVVDSLANVDLALKKNFAKLTGGDEKQVKSVLKKQDSFNYAVIFRGTGKAPIVEPMEAPWKVYDAICSLEKKPDPTNNTMLLNGLAYMYDIIVEKRQNPKTNRPDYLVDVDNRSLITCGKIPIAYADKDKNPYPQPEQFFNVEDLTAIQATTWDLEVAYKALTTVEVAEMVKKYPIDLGRRDKQNASVFLFFSNPADLHSLVNYAQTADINILLPNQQDMAPQSQGPALSAPVGQQVLPAAGPGPVNAEYSVIPNQPVQQPVVQQPVFTPAPAAQQPVFVPQPAAAVVQQPVFVPAPTQPTFTPAQAAPWEDQAAQPMATKVAPVREGAASSASATSAAFVAQPSQPAPAAFGPAPGGAPVLNKPDLGW